MDPKMLEINNLRVLNDYLNQTIDVILRTQRLGAQTVTPGLSHTPYMAAGIFGSPVLGNVALDPTYATLAGLSHSPVSPVSPFAPALSVTSPLAATAAYATPWTSPFAAAVDPFIAQRGLSHTAALPVTAWSPISEIARQELTRAIVARQVAFDAACRAFGIPV